MRPLRAHRCLIRFLKVRLSRLSSANSNIRQCDELTSSLAGKSQEDQLPMLPLGFIGLPGSLWSLKERSGSPGKSQNEGQDAREE